MINSAAKSCIDFFFKNFFPLTKTSFNNTLNVFYLTIHKEQNSYYKFTLFGEDEAGLSYCLFKTKEPKPDQVEAFKELLKEVFSVGIDNKIELILNPFLNETHLYTLKLSDKERKDKIQSGEICYFHLMK